MRRVKRWLPLLVSLCLLAFVAYRVSPAKVAAAAGELQWQWLVPVTIGLVFVLYFWDAVCFRAVYELPGGTLDYRRALHLRGTSYLAGALNYELGHFVVAFGAAEAQQASVLTTLSRSLLLAYHDALVLLSLGLLGALLTSHPSGAVPRVVCLVGVGLLLLVATIPRWLSAERKLRFRDTRWGQALADWTFGRSIELAWRRAVYFGFQVVYAAAALAICDVPVDALVVLGTIPLVLLADGLPSISGLGTRETTLTLLLQPPRPEVIVALSLLWSTVVLSSRLVLGLAHLWIPRWRRRWQAK